ncbi:MAG: hypothetical protein H6621_05055 [Halobacteriovoraceae bacterium]|nr:hypothetical protein [Halobacteriovoraceae bacterium]
MKKFIFFFLISPFLLWARDITIFDAKVKAALFGSAIPFASAGGRLLYDTEAKMVKWYFDATKVCEFYSFFELTRGWVSVMSRGNIASEYIREKISEGPLIATKVIYIDREDDGDTPPISIIYQVAVREDFNSPEVKFRIIDLVSTLNFRGEYETSALVDKDIVNFDNLYFLFNINGFTISKMKAQKGNQSPYVSYLDQFPAVESLD